MRVDPSLRSFAHSQGDTSTAAFDYSGSKRQWPSIPSRSILSLTCSLLRQGYIGGSGKVQLVLISGNSHANLLRSGPQQCYGDVAPNPPFLRSIICEGIFYAQNPTDPPTRNLTHSSVPMYSLTCVYFCQEDKLCLSIVDN